MCGRSDLVRSQDRRSRGNDQRVQQVLPDRSYPDYLGGTTKQRALRDLLRRTMEDEDFKVYDAEWWHFDYHAWRQYPILNETFEKLRE